VLFNDEIDAVIIDDDFGRQMEALFKDDIAASRQIDPNTWRHRSLGERIKEYSSRLVEYLL
jgi:cardiolipin synthase